MPKIRLDVLLVERRLVESRALAQRMILAGQVQVDGSTALKPGTRVSPESRVSLEQGPRYVSRGGGKLEAALQTFNLEVTNKICADVGASTGGFTDCLLQHGAA
ncbi:MAG: TlyA family rRNA (cytidine-2'-O)-methyltransferase, partial [Anaerolineales bacterium]|nr:TlyA family rRNA (cytidine-2'-O)-methyltransferase [Anaerolineales bacterium]